MPDPTASSTTTTALRRCVGDPQEFVERIWARRPLLRQGADATAFADLMSMSDVEALISGHGLRFPALKVLEGGTSLPPERFTRHGRVGGVPLSDLIDPTAVYARFESGATVVLNALHRHWPAVGRFCRELEAELTYPVQANLYLTPPEAQGLNIHYDSHDVFVLQLDGTKRWHVWEPPIEAPLTVYQGRFDPERPGEQLLDETLGPGDALYVPRGFLHAAATVEETSAHITIGLVAPTWISLLQTLTSGLDDEPAFRRALAPGYASDPRFGAEVAGTLERFQAWLQDVDPEALAEQQRRLFLDSRPPAPRP